MKRKKIACIGAGNIGGEVASHCAILELGNIVLVDMPNRDQYTRGKALDILHASALTESDVEVRGTSELIDIADAHVCIVSAGIARTSNISRDDLFDANVKTIMSIGKAIKAYAPKSFVIVITNPLDIMTYVMRETTGFADNMVVGMAGMLDSARFRALLAAAIGCSVKDVHSLVLGGHGDLMVPVVSYCTVNAVPVRELLDETTLNHIIEETRFAGGTLVKMIGTSAYYAAAKAACQMAESYLKDQKRLMPCSVYLDGPYNLHDIYIGVPVIVGKSGVERILELKLSAQESLQLQKSAEYLKNMCAKARLLIS
ncbi:MAG: malate dehydrogenase [Chitinivibrionales bacterium]|nr:malate dehydrogenase [Chitinivibrionales bacterium]